MKLFPASITFVRSFRVHVSAYRGGVLLVLLGILIVTTLASSGCAAEPVTPARYAGAKYKGRATHQGIPTWSTWKGPSQ